MQKSIFIVSYISNETEFISMLGLVNRAYNLCGKINGTVKSIIFAESDYEVDKIIYSGSDEVQVFTVSRILEDFQVNLLDNIFRKNRPYAILAINSHWSRSILPRLAARLDAGLTADCIKIEIDQDGLLRQIRPAKEKSTLATIVSPYTVPQMATVQDGIYQLLNMDCNRKGKIIRKFYKLPDIECQRIMHKYERKIERQSKIVIAIGRGINTKQNLVYVERLAILLNADIVVTRPLIENGWFDKTHLVGMSGKTVSPSIYIAIGISGAVQHMMGVNKADIIIAINNDKNAMIFDYASYGIVGDSGLILQKIIKKI